MNSAGALRFGGNNVWSEWFAGALDEIRDLRPRADPGRAAVRHDHPGHLQRHPAAAAGAVGLAEQPVLHRHRRAARTRPRRRFDVTNTGGGTLSYTASESALVAHREPRRAAPRRARVTATPSIAGPRARHLHRADHRHRGGRHRFAEDGRRDAHGQPGDAGAVGGAREPRVHRHAGGANPAAQTVNVTNTGGGTLNFTAPTTSPGCA